MNEEVKNSMESNTPNNQSVINSENNTNMYPSGEEIVNTPPVVETPNEPMENPVVFGNPVPPISELSNGVNIETTQVDTPNVVIDNQITFGNPVPPVSEPNSEVNIETPEINPVVPENVTPETPEKNPEFEDFRDKKSKKGLIISLIIFVAIVIGAALGVKYFLSQNTAEAFLEHNIEKVATSISNLIDSDSPELKDIYKDDLTSNINLKLTTDASDLKAYNNIELSAKTNINLNDNYADVDATLKQNTANLKGTFVLTSDKVYIDSEDIFNKLLYTDMEEDYFKTIKEYLEEYEDTLSASDIKTLITNLGKYLNDALKQAKMTTKYNGLTVTYTYEINDNNQENILKSLENSLKSDEIIKKLASDSITLEDIYLDNIKVELTFNIINQKLESGLVTTEDTQLIIEKLEDNKYQIKEKDNNEEYIEIDTSSDAITITYFEDGVSAGTINLKNTDKEFILVLSSDEVNMNLTITAGDTKNIKLEVKYDKYVVNLDMNMKLENNSQVLDGYVSVKMNEESIKVTFTTDTKWGTNLFTKKNTNNATYIENLSDEESMEVLTNILTKVSAFPFYSELSSLLSPSYDDDSYIDSTYDDDNEYYYGL